MSSAAADLARALHHAADLLVGRGHEEQALEDARRLVEAANELLSQGEELTPEHRVLVFATEMVAELGAPVPPKGEYFDAFSLSPFSGASNALRPKEITYQRVGDEVRAEMVAGIAYEGATGRAHGGLLAAVFDDLMGALQRIIGHHGFTRTLDVSYLGPVPIDEPVIFVARLESVQERTFTLTSEVTHNGEVVATAEAVFTKVDFSRLERGAAAEG